MIVVVTGASSGVGLAAAQEFARRGAQVIVVGRHPGRLAHAVDLVRHAGNGRTPDQFRADFTRLAEVRALADHLLAAYPRIDVLADNAGGIVARHAVTPDGYESTVQANHLAAFLLTNLLRDRLRGGRVVVTASDAHRMGRIDPDDLVGDPARYGKWRTYGASKAANILFAAEAARRWPDVLTTSFHPGVVRTNFGPGALVRLFYKVAPGLATPAQGADTLVWLATAATEEIVSGGYYVNRRRQQPDPSADDPDVAARLWQASAAAVGL